MQKKRLSVRDYAAFSKVRMKLEYSHAGIISIILCPINVTTHTTDSTSNTIQLKFESVCGILGVYDSYFLGPNFLKIKFFFNISINYKYLGH